MDEGFRIWANPSSPHAEGRKAKAALEDARERIKRALGLGQGDKNYELIFTSGASEALAIGLQRAKVDRRIISAVEHDAVFRAAPDAEIVPLDDIRVGVDLAKLEASLAKGPAIVALQAVNPETGLCFFQDGGFTSTREVHSMVREKGGMILSDCSQSAGRLRLPSADMLVISAHKFGGPIGIGALLVKDYAMLEPIGGHERGYRQGTENLPGALGMAAALEAPRTGANPFRESRAFHELLTASGCWDETGYDCCYIFALTHPTISAQALLIRLDAMGFAVSAGSACSSGTLKKSRVLDAFGVADDVAARTIRVSIGWNTTADDLDRFAEAWAGL
jgi:cysteine desulfurase